VVVGHSLGGGAAALLAMMLHPKYPLTLCYAYGMPGSVMDEITSKECSHYVFSCVLGFDFVCRMNLSSVVRLRENVIVVTLLRTVHSLALGVDFVL
jgi:sn1-specific diacylglycerol lipase